MQSKKKIITCRKLILKEEEGEIRTSYNLQTGRFFSCFFLFFFAFDFTVHCICAATKAAGGGDGEARGLQLHDVLLALGHVAGHLSATLNQAGVLHPVHLDLPLDDGGVVGDGSLEHGGDRDGDMGSGGLGDLGGGT